MNRNAGESVSDTPRILVVDDEKLICQNCVKILSKMDCVAEYALNGYDALKMMEKRPYDVVITDLKMGSLGGMEVLRRVRESFPGTRVIVITGYASVSSAVEVMKLGAFDYLPKPFTPHEFRAVVLRAVTERESFGNRKTANRGVSHQLIGTSPKIKTVIQMIQKVAPTDSTVLIYGESGTGKELVARAVHANSLRKDAAFFALDCGSLTENLLESELFGYTKGAFTGAAKNKDGIFKLADRGTVFLDEIGNISMEVQGKLLRFLESRDFMPLGADSVQKVDVRLIFATNKDLDEMVAQGAFREDFYYRIFVYPIILPPLRERKSDISPIAHHFLSQFNRTMEKTMRGFDDTALGRLTEYDWPGNVRQLRNIVERAVILCDREIITQEFLKIPGDKETNPMCRSVPVPQTNEELKMMRKEIREKAVSDLERAFLLNALKMNDWNVTRAARETGLQRTNFQKMMQKQGISLPERGKS